MIMLTLWHIASFQLLLVVQSTALPALIYVPKPIEIGNLHPRTRVRVPAEVVEVIGPGKEKSNLDGGVHIPGVDDSPLISEVIEILGPAKDRKGLHPLGHAKEISSFASPLIPNFKMS